MKIIAHRGNDGVHKDNSLEAIINSLSKDYVDGVEFDIRMTSDFKFVVCHDPFYRGLLIRETRLKKLQKRGLVSLEETLINVNNNKILLIEIKEESKKYKILVAKLYRILKKYNLNYYIFSFNYDLMEYFKEKYPNMKSGILIGIKKNLSKINNSFDFNAVNYRYADKTPLKESFIWTVNNLKEFEKVKDWQNIITDKPLFFYNIKN